MAGPIAGLVPVENDPQRKWGGRRALLTVQWLWLRPHRTTQISLSWADRGTRRDGKITECTRAGWEKSIFDPCDPDRAARARLGYRQTDDIGEFTALGRYDCHSEASGNEARNAAGIVSLETD